MSIREQWGLQAPLGAAELYWEGSCYELGFLLTSLAILGQFPVLPDQQVYARSYTPCGRVRLLKCCQIFSLLIRTRTYTNPNDTEANAAGGSGNDTVLLTLAPRGRN